MAGLWRKAPSPCIGICKRPGGGACIGCGMTKPEKKLFARKRSKAERKPMFRLFMARLEEAGRLARWEHVYRRRCERKDKPCPLDKL